MKLQKSMKATLSLFSKDNLPRLLVMVVLLFLLYYVYTTYLKEGFTDVKPAEFSDQVTPDKKTLVLFYADWCGHCKKLKPDWDAAAKDANKEETKMIKVNCGEGTKEDKAIMEKYNIDGYPTIIIFDNGTPSTYEGGRSKADLLAIV